MSWRSSRWFSLRVSLALEYGALATRRAFRGESEPGALERLRLMLVIEHRDEERRVGASWWKGEVRWLGVNVEHEHIPAGTYIAAQGGHVFAESPSKNEISQCRERENNERPGRRDGC